MSQTAFPAMRQLYEKVSFPGDTVISAGVTDVRGQLHAVPPPSEGAVTQTHEAARGVRRPAGRDVLLVFHVITTPRTRPGLSLSVCPETLQGRSAC